MSDTNEEIAETKLSPAMPEIIESNRIIGYDVARAIAILGMVVVHFSLVAGNGRADPQWLSFVLSLLDGRATAVFVILAGIGVTFMSRKAVVSGDGQAIDHAQRVLVRRGLLLLGFGFGNLWIWPGDILRVYGVSLLLAARMITATGRRLLMNAAGFEIGFVILFLTLDFESHWDWRTMTYRGLWTPTGLVRNLFYDGFRSVFPWTGLLFFGMWLGRLDLRNAAINRRIGIVAFGIFASAESISRLCVAFIPASSLGMPPESVKALFGTESMPALPLFLLASGGLAVVLTAACVRLVDSSPGRQWLPLAATGQMALTWYIAHIILGLGTIVAMDLTGSLPLRIAAGYGVAFFSVAVVVSWLWKRKFRHGPLEWCLRKVCS